MFDNLFEPVCEPAAHRLQGILVDGRYLVIDQRLKRNRLERRIWKRVITMKTKLTTLVLTTLIIWSTVFAADPAEYLGVVTVDSVQARPGQSFAVPVWLRGNNMEISALTIPLKFASPDLRLDSVVLNDVIWGADFSGIYLIDNNAQTVRITILPSDIAYPIPTVSAVDGIIARLYFSLDGLVAAGSIPIDSIYIDDILSNDVHLYTRIDVSNQSGSEIYQPGFLAGQIAVLDPTAVDDGLGAGNLPTEYELAQNYPNPFNPTTTISFSLPQAGAVKLEVFNILGQQVADLVNSRLEAGIHNVTFDAGNMPSGIYFYRLAHTEGVETRKMMLVK